MSNRSSRRASDTLATAARRPPRPPEKESPPVVAERDAPSADVKSAWMNSSCVNVRRAIVAPSARGIRGQGLEVAYGFHESPFGLSLLLLSDGRGAEGLCGLAFAGHQAEKIALLTGMCSRWPKAVCREAPMTTASYANKVFSPEFLGGSLMVDVVFYGTEFELAVWRALLAIPLGTTATYSDIAHAVGSPLAVRAVGAAISRNPLAYVAPCHRVSRKDGGLGGYRWGASRKQAMIKWENAWLTGRQDGGKGGAA